MEKIILPSYIDNRGTLIVVESKKQIPFEIKRVYYIMNTTSGEPRGFHAHKELVQFAVCLKGECRILFDDGITKYVSHLNTESEGVLIPPMVWHEMYDFSADCILLVLANDNYNELDYIRCYDDFIRLKNNE